MVTADVAPSRQRGSPGSSMPPGGRPAAAASAGPAAEAAEPSEATLPIGRAAALLGVSERTLRYYEEIGLLRPAGRTPGRTRHYAQADLARVARIKELRDLLGFNLDEIRTILANEDRLEELRREYRAGAADPARQAQLLAEGLAIQEDLRAKVVAKVAKIDAFLGELDARLERLRALAAQLEGARTAVRPVGTRGGGRPGHGPSSRVVDATSPPPRRRPG